MARDARNGVAANQTSENIAAQLSAFRQVVGNGADVATWQSSLLKFSRVRLYWQTWEVFRSIDSLAM
jgi:hypothetical protein